MYSGAIDESGADLYPDLQILPGESAILLFHMDSRQFSIINCLNTKLSILRTEVEI